MKDDFFSSSEYCLIMLDMPSWTALMFIYLRSLMIYVDGRCW